MKKFVLFAIVVGALIWGLKDFVQSGRLERFLDQHPNPQLNAKIEYYWGLALGLANHKPAAYYRLQRVVSKYEETPEAPSAWVIYIQLLTDSGEREKALDQCQLFIAKYPNHPDSETMRRRLAYQRGGGV